MMKLFVKENVTLDFIIVGTQKGGTSALAHYLKQHEDIAMASKKELHFFDNDALFSKKKVSYNPLNEYFGRRKETNKIYGEATPIYMYWDQSIERIHKHNPQMKLIAILRNPIERAFSHWNMEAKKNKENKDFKTCIIEEIAEIKANKKQKHRTFSYVDRGLYANQIERIYKYFPKEQVLFMKYEDFLTEQNKSLEQVFDFLNVSGEGYHFEKKTMNKIEYSSAIQNAEVAMLRDFFNPEIEKVEALLGWDCSRWKNN